MSYHVLTEGTETMMLILAAGTRIGLRAMQGDVLELGNIEPGFVCGGQSREGHDDGRDGNKRGAA